MKSSFSFSRYVGTMVAITWTLGWLVGADCAAKFWVGSRSNVALVNLVLTLLPVAFGMRMIFRVFPRDHGPQAATPPDSSQPEPWYRRITSGFALVVWCAGAVVWNLAVFNVAVRGDMKGQTLNIIFAIPFSAIGMLLLFVLFTAIAMLFDFVCRTGDKTETPTASEPVLPPPARRVLGQQRPLEEAKADMSHALKDMPIHGALAALSWFNWFVFAAFSVYWGGDAIGILPSQDGFVLKSHGHHTTVSETVWVISLFYGAATLLGTPAIWISFIARGFLKYRPKGAWYVKAGIGVFITVWCIGWFGGMGGDFVKSYKDWKNFKHPAAMQSSANPTSAKH